jgi:hypothetical protein
MAFAIPNYGTAAFPGQAEPDAVDFDILALSFQRTGVLSGCAVSAKAPASMFVAVAVGTVLIGGTTVAVAAGDVTILSAEASARFDLIVVNAAGTKSAVKGTAASNPVFPAIPASSAVLASVYVPAGDTAIDANQIVDKRMVISPWNPSTFNVKDYGAVGDGTTDDTTAIQAAYTAANAFGGGIVLYPIGRYKTTASVTCYANTVSVGAGRNSVYVLTNATQDGLVFDPGAFGIGVQDLRFQVDGVDKTAGATVKLVGNKKCFFRDVWWDGYTEETHRHFRCLSITGLARWISCTAFDMVSISSNTDAAGIYISQDAGGWGYYFSQGTVQTQMRSDGTEFTTCGYAGLYLAAIDGARFTAIEFIDFHQACVLIRPPATGYQYVTHVRIQSCAIEIAVHYAVDIDASASNGNVVSKVWFTDTTIYGDPGDALHVKVNTATGDNAPQVNELAFKGVKFSRRSLIEHTGTSTALTDLRLISFTNCSWYCDVGGGLYALTIDGQCDRWSMVGCQVEVSTGTYGVTVTAGVYNTRHSVVGCDFSGVAAAQKFMDYNTGTGRKVRLGNNPKTANTGLVKTAWLPAEKFKAVVGAASGSLGGGYDMLSTRVMAKADNGHCIGTLVLPSTCVGYIAINVHWAMPDATAGNVYWSVDYRLIVAGGDVIAAGTTVQSTIASGSAASLLKIWAAVSAVAPSLDQVNLLRIDVRRDGTQGTDTCAAAAHFIGAEVTWAEYLE